MSVALATVTSCAVTGGGGAATCASHHRLHVAATPRQLLENPAAATGTPPNPRTLATANGAVLRCLATPATALAAATLAATTLAATSTAVAAMLGCGVGVRQAIIIKNHR